METMPTKGKFIVFEGTDGSGKSTQMKLLGKYLQEKGVPCYFTHEPTDSPFGALLRSCLSGRIDADEHAIALLFAADRIDHITNSVNGIRSKLEAGYTVLCDRYYYSSFAYNGGFVPIEWVKTLNAPAMDMLRPDLVIYLDLSAEASMKRVLRRGETERYETQEKQKKIRENFFEVFKQLKDENIRVIKSEDDKFATQSHIRCAVEEILGDAWKKN